MYSFSEFAPIDLGTSSLLQPSFSGIAILLKIIVLSTLIQRTPPERSGGVRVFVFLLLRNENEEIPVSVKADGEIAGAPELEERLVLLHLI